MKLIVAMIRPEELEALLEALSDPDACLMSVGEVCDLRHQRSNATVEPSTVYLRPG